MNPPFSKRVMTVLLALAAIILAVGLLFRGRAADAKESGKEPSAEPVRALQSSTGAEERQSSRNRVAKKPAGDGNLEEAYKEDTYESRLARGVLEPYDDRSLVLMAEKPIQDTRVFSDLVLRAAAEKDAKFKYLLERKDLREDSRVSFALDAYDYNVNGNRAALELILASQVNNQPGWDSNEVWALSCIDEWDLTKKALEARIMSGDGTGGDARYAFWLKRRILFPNSKAFPKDYQKFQEDLYEQQKISQRSAPPLPPVEQEE